MREVKASTKRGQHILSMGERCIFPSLDYLYNNWSAEKQRAYIWCRDEYTKDEKSTAFGVGNANCFGFTASWLLIKDGEECMRVETKDNSYLVWLQR